MGNIYIVQSNEAPQNSMFSQIPHMAVFSFPKFKKKQERVKLIIVEVLNEAHHYREAEV